MSQRGRAVLRFSLQSLGNAVTFLLVMYITGLVAGSRSSARFFEDLATGWFVYGPTALGVGVLVTLVMRRVARWESARAARRGSRGKSSGGE
jgi:hypothetical protein